MEPHLAGGWWEHDLDGGIRLALVAELFSDRTEGRGAPERTRKELLQEAAYVDRFRIVLRTAGNAAADTEGETLRDFLEGALTDDDARIRWREIRAIGSLGVNRSYPALEDWADDLKFRVRFEVKSVLRGEAG